ncbi:MAG: histidine phosphatase family protein [Pseudomonadota bacterium]
MPTPTLYYIRHGETEWNATGRFQGTQDIPLNDKGRGQAADAGRVLGDLIKRNSHDHTLLPYVSSPLGRARETMELVRGALTLPVAGYSLDPRLREIGYGQWEGMTLPQMEQHDAATFASRKADVWNVAAPGGESYASVTARMQEWFEQLVGDTVVVAHGGTMRALMVALGVATPAEAAKTAIGQGVVYVFGDGAVTKYG